MSRKWLRAAALTLVAFSLVAGACFQIRFVKIDPKSLANGEQGEILINLYRLSDDSDAIGYAFILFGLDTELTLSLVTPFDPQGNWGGPFSAVSDNALRDYLLADGQERCSAGGVDADTVQDFNTFNWYLYRTNAKIDSSLGALGSKIKTKIKVARSSADNTGRGDFVVFSGIWTDGDNGGAGDVDSGEFLCTGMVYSSIPFKP